MNEPNKNLKEGRQIQNLENTWRQQQLSLHQFNALINEQQEGAQKISAFEEMQLDQVTQSANYLNLFLTKINFYGKYRRYLFIILLLVISLIGFHFYNTFCIQQLQQSEVKEQNQHKIHFIQRNKTIYQKNLIKTTNNQAEINKNQQKNFTVKDNNSSHHRLQGKIFSNQSKGTIYDLVMLDDSSALCLDGSRGGYYISRNHMNSTRFLIYFQGGGWCSGRSQETTLQNCFQRSQTDLGSSNMFKAQIIQYEGYSSQDQRNNFKNWTKVIFKYCDGSGHQGSKKKPVIFNNTLLYFRGHNITLAQFNTLQKNNKLFSQATDIVLSGASAGGLAAHMWINYVVQRVKIAKVLLIADSAVFLNQKDFITNQYQYNTGMINLMKFSNAEIDPPVSQCVQKFKNAKQNCMYAQNIYMYSKVPTFHIQSLYDRWSISHILNISCVIYNFTSSLQKCNSQERNAIQEYHKKLKKIIVYMREQSQNGVWAPACVDHVYLKQRYFSTSYRIPQSSQYSVAQSIKRWMQKKQSNKILIDNQKWPSNKLCSGTLNSRIIQLQNII